jgi:hypothetical protein
MNSSSPKYDALISFSADNPCWWNGCASIPAPPPAPGSITVAIHSPGNGTTIKRNGSVNIAVSASDARGVASIAVIVDGNTLQTCTNTTTCSATWHGKKIEEGTHSISATATGKDGTQAKASVTVTALR